MLNLGPFENRLNDGMVRSSPRVENGGGVELFSFKCNDAVK